MKQPDGVICFATNCNHDHSKMTEDQRVYQNHHLDYIRREYVFLSLERPRVLEMDRITSLSKTSQGWFQTSTV